MKYTIIITTLILNLNLIVRSQTPKFKNKYIDPITETSLKKHVYALASDSLKGRSTGTEGEAKAAKYIAQHFKTYGLLPYNDSTYFQNIGLWAWNWGDISIKIDADQLAHYQDIVYLSSPMKEPIEAKCVYIGNGNDSIISNIDLKNKIVFATVSNLRSWYSIAMKTKHKGALAIILMHQSDNDAFQSISKQIHSSHQNKNVSSNKPSFSSKTTKAFAIDRALAKCFFGVPADSLSQYTTAQQIKTLPQPKLSVFCPAIIKMADACNVAAYLPGKTQTNATIVISAHYDHIGERNNGIAYGADDNASGTAAVLELAKVLSPLKGKLDKNIVFLTTTGEEKGLLGAFYFADHPTVHGFDIRANINIDMIGRIDSTHKSNYIYTIGNHYYPEFDSLLHVANSMVDPLSIQDDYNKSQGFGNMLNLSDHYAFHRKNIPIMGFFSGLHEDYHKTSDTADKIDYKEMEQRVKLIYTTAFLATQKTAFIPQTD